MREHYIFVNIFANICIWYAPIFANAHWCTSEESGAWPTLEPTVTPLGLSRFLLSKKMPKFNAQNHPKCNINMLIRNFTSSLGLLTPTHPQFRTLSSTFSGFKDTLLDVTVFPATENTFLDLELTAGNGKMTLVFKLLLSAINQFWKPCLPHFQWFQDGQSLEIDV